MVPIGVAAAWLSMRSHDNSVLPNTKAAINERGRKVSVGGISRPATDVWSGRSAGSLQQDSKVGAGGPGEVEGYYDRYGRIPIVASNANQAVISAYEALTQTGKSERLSLLLEPRPFNIREYTDNPQSYLGVFEPGRAWQTAQPGPGVPVLTPLTPPRQTLVQGETVRLRVRTLAGFPVTFTSLDLGMFDNQLPSVSVAADASGEAVALFTASPGTAGRINILAASPGASEQARFQLIVALPDGDSAAAFQER